MSKVLVVYGTKSGCTAGIAEKIGETLAATGATVSVKSAVDKPNPAGYDAVVVGSGVRASNWHGAAKAWVSTNAELLKSMPAAFFTVGLIMAATPEKADTIRAYTDPLIAETGVTPVAIGLFAGSYEPSRFSMPERLIMKAMKAKEGDFRDFEAVAVWATETAPLLGLV